MNRFPVSLLRLTKCLKRFDISRQSWNNFLLSEMCEICLEMDVFVINGQILHTFCETPKDLQHLANV